MQLKNIYICFPEGKNKVLTMSYDDGRIEDKRLVDMFNQYGIKGTFHINSGLMNKDRVKPEEWGRVYQGHEISCHTVLHPTIERCPLDHVALQILEDRRILERAAGYPVRGMSYPNGSYTKEIIQMLPGLGIEYSRIVGNTDAFGMPDDFLEWKSTCHHNHNLLENAERFLALNKKQYLYMMYVWGHSFEFSRDNNWELMEEFCRMVSEKNDIWYASNIEIVDYIKAAKQLRYTIDGDKVYNPTGRNIWISVEHEIVFVPAGELIVIEK